MVRIVKHKSLSISFISSSSILTNRAPFITDQSFWVFWRICGPKVPFVHLTMWYYTIKHNNITVFLVTRFVVFVKIKFRQFPAYFSILHWNTAIWQSTKRAILLRKCLFNLSAENYPYIVGPYNTELKDILLIIMIIMSGISRLKCIGQRFSSKVTRFYLQIPRKSRKSFTPICFLPVSRTPSFLRACIYLFTTARTAPIIFAMKLT